MDDEHDRLERDSELGPKAPVDLLQESDEQDRPRPIRLVTIARAAERDQLAPLHVVSVASSRCLDFRRVWPILAIW